MKSEKFNITIEDCIPAICLIVFTLLFLIFFHPVTIVGSSMENTLVNGDFGFMVRDWIVDEYQNGDVVIIMTDIGGQEKCIVKRIIATEGQTIGIDCATGTVKVNGVVQNEPYIIGTTARCSSVEYSTAVESGHIFVMGDNREISYDSRAPGVGQIPIEDILGKLVFLVFPGYDQGYDFSRIGLVS